MSDDYSHYLPGVDALHKLMGYADYQQVLGFIDGLPILEESKEELRDRFGYLDGGPPSRYAPQL